MLRQKILHGVLRQTRTFSNAAVDPIQKASLQEMCILTNFKDEIIGQATKEECHKLKEGKLPLHRAFSVFLFNDKNELLLHRRAPNKITFPNQVTNSCCSHPIYSYPEERNEKDALGVKLAAIRRLNYELGVPLGSIKPSDLKFVTRFIYKSMGDGVWGEYEIDYVLFAKKNVEIKPNPNEIGEVYNVGLDNFDSFLKDLKYPLTPWFHLMVKNELTEWWKNIDCLEKFMNHTEILRLS